MKLIGFSALLIATTLNVQAAKPLKSKTIKGLVCSDLEAKVYDDLTNIDEKRCVKEGKFSVTGSTFDESLGTTAVLNISFSYEEKNILMEGTANAVRVVRFLSNGQRKLSWNTTEMKVRVSDNRSYEQIFNALFDNDEVNTHNGDAGINSVDSRYTLKKMVQELEESLENYGDPQTDREYDYCVYFTETDTNSVIEYMGDYSSDLETLLLQMKKKGQIKGAAFRGYEDGASEYCSNFYFRILTNDGKVIYVDFDFTT